METIFTNLSQFIKANAFFCGGVGIILSILLIIGLVYLFLKRNEVMTLTYGLTLLSMVFFIVACIVVMFFAGVYGITSHSSNQSKTILSKQILIVLFILILTPIFSFSQGINYPGNSPVNNGGAGIARTDADNLFTHNNAAAMTEIEDDEKVGDNLGRMRIMSEFHFTYYKYKRDWTSLGFNKTVTSQDSIALPTASGEITYTAKSRKYAVGIGLSQTFRFESKLKVLGSQPNYFVIRSAFCNSICNPSSPFSLYTLLSPNI